MDVSLSEFRELVMDREDWRAEIHGVAKSRTRLSDWTELNSNSLGFISRLIIICKVNRRVNIIFIIQIKNEVQGL